jgi:hypothetical protein
MIIGKELINPRVTRILRGVPIPFELVVVILGTAVSYFIGTRLLHLAIMAPMTGLHDKYQVKYVDYVPPGIPTPKVPDFSVTTIYGRLE